MSEHSITVKWTDEDEYTVFFDDNEVCNCTYDFLGSDGMEKVSYILEMVSRKFGIPIYTEGY